ncbi:MULTISPECIES: hypothetical protein [Thermoprotei]|uniref:hypothetical protein n=1 Tax=Thermoprotei TaxID=183924 RepID=UPI003160BF37
MARNIVAKLVMGFFFILDVFFIIYLGLDFLRTLGTFIFSLIFLRPLSLIFFFELVGVTILLIGAILVGEWLWREIEE